MASISDLVYSTCCRLALLTALFALFCLNYASKYGFSGIHDKIDSSAIVFLYPINFFFKLETIAIKKCSV